MTTLTEEKVRAALDKLKAPDVLTESFKKYNKLGGFHNSFEYMGKVYESCHVCGFSPEVMNTAIDQAVEEILALIERRSI